VIAIPIILFAVSHKPIRNEEIRLTESIRDFTGEIHLFLSTSGGTIDTGVDKVIKLTVKQGLSELTVSVLEKGRFFGRYFTNQPQIEILLPSEEMKEKWQRQLNKQLPEPDVVVLKQNFGKTLRIYPGNEN